MQCKHCDTTMHMDSTGVCSCVSCGHRHDQSKLVSTCGATYSNKGILQGEEPKVAKVTNPDLQPDALAKAVNDAGEKLQSVEDTLVERGNRYGEFKNHALLSQTLKQVFTSHVIKHGQPENFTYEMNEAISMIMHKLARIANGDPQYSDNWVDICGYSQLVVDELNKKR